MKFSMRTIRVRLTLWYTLVLTAIVIVFALGVYLFVRQSLLNQLKAGLMQNVASVETILAREPDQLFELEDRGSVPFFQVTEDGDVIYRSRRWGRAGLAVFDVDETMGRFRVWEAEDGSDYYFHAARARVDGRDVVIATAVDTQITFESVRILALILLIGLPAALAMGVVGGYFLAGRVLAPVGRIASKAQEITADKLSERLPVHNPDDEFGRLALVFNRTLERLERAFVHMRRFTADASHELRTPLTAMRSVGEVAIQEDDKNPSFYQDVIGSMLEEVDRLSALVDNLLTLTRGDEGQVPLDVKEITLADFVSDVVEQLRVLAEEKKQSLEIKVHDPITVRIDRAKLKQGLINLVDNALKYTPEGGSILIVIRKSSRGQAFIEVCDDGIGIARDNHDKVFDRFFRESGVRSSAVGGAGLGLSVAQWAIEMNGGSIELESSPGNGSTFRIVLPKSLIVTRAAPASNSMATKASLES